MAELSRNRLISGGSKSEISKEARRLEMLIIYTFKDFFFNKNVGLTSDRPPHNLKNNFLFLK